MKKILVCLGITLLLSGCGETTDSLQCKQSITANGLTTNTTYNIDYDEDDVEYVTITYNYSQDEYTTEDNMDGVGTGTDGTTEDDDINENDGIVDGVVGDTIDEGVETITETILDIAGIKNNYEQQLTAYNDIEGFDYTVDRDLENEYTVVYKIDLNKINDTDLQRFNIDRNLTNLRTTYETQGYTCK